MNSIMSGRRFGTSIAVGLALVWTALANDQFQQFANSEPLTWQNGNLHSGNSHYTEGDSVPFRYEITGLPENASIEFHIYYDFTKGGIHAYDFLTGYDLTEAEAIAANGGLFGDVPLTTLTESDIHPHALAIPDDPTIGTDDLLRSGTGTQYLAICGAFTNAYVLTTPAFGSSSDVTGDTEKFLALYGFLWVIE
jgi:hypothetical protein